LKGDLMSWSNLTKDSGAAVIGSPIGGEAPFLVGPVDYSLGNFTVPLQSNNNPSTIGMCLAFIQGDLGSTSPFASLTSMSECLAVPGIKKLSVPVGPGEIYAFNDPVVGYVADAPIHWVAATFTDPNDVGGFFAPQNFGRPQPEMFRAPQQQYSQPQQGGQYRSQTQPQQYRQPYRAR